MVWALEIVFVCGLALLSAAFNVFVRDTRYMVESATWVLLFLVPVFYDSNLMPEQIPLDLRLQSDCRDGDLAAQNRV